MQAPFRPFFNAAVGRAAARVTIATLLAVGGAIIALRLVEPQYSAALTVGPTARSGAAAVGLRAPEGGRDAMAAVAEPGPADEVLSDFTRYLELLRSTPVAERLMLEPELARRLFADRWDVATQSWGPPAGGWAALKRGILASVGRRGWSVPDAVALAQLLRERLIVSPVGTGPMRRIVFRHADRDFALAVLRRLTAAADEHLRAEAARRAQAQIDHVRARLATVASAEHRSALGRLLADEERVLMALGVDLPYAADVVEPPHAAALPDWPDALLVIAASGLAGLSISLFAVGRRLWGWRPSAAEEER